MDDNPLERRRLALEESFFQKHNDELADKLRASFERSANREQLAEATGIQNVELLDRLIVLQVSGETMSAFALSPLVWIAWADGSVSEAELAAVLTAAREEGLSEKSLAYRLLESGLTTRPTPEAREAWAAYASDLRSRLQPAELDAIRDELIGRARRVAEASGGILGFGSKISSQEQAILDEITAAFSN